MDLEHKTIERLKMASEMSLGYYGKPLVCTYSGGKDSDVMLELFKRAGIPFEARHSHTSADAPPTIYHIRKTFRELEIGGVHCGVDYHEKTDGSRITLWNLIPEKRMPPTRRVRYCCSILKETGCPDRMIATGIRWDESNNRKGRESFEIIASRKENAVHISDEKMLISDNDERRQLFEQCAMKAKTVVNPIIDWKDSDIWDYYKSECKCHNPLYSMGFTRVGCIGCPMAGKARYMEFREFPAYKKMYIHAFDRMLEARKQLNLDYRKDEYKRWKSGQDVFAWYMEDKNISGQYVMEIDKSGLTGKYKEK